MSATKEKTFQHV